MHRGIVGLVTALAMSPSFACFGAAKHISIDTGECGEDTPAKTTIIKSDEFSDKVHRLKAYGELSISRFDHGPKDTGCHVIYRLFIASAGGQFQSAKEMTWEAEYGQIAGIDLIGTSKDGTKFAADFLWAEGDGTVHHPVVFDRANNHTVDMSLEDKIQKRIHSCDQVEDFVGVTDAGEAVFAVPPSIYDDSPGCGDKGLWHFNLKTGKVYRVARVSGDRWE